MERVSLLFVMLILLTSSTTKVDTTTSSAVFTLLTVSLYLFYLLYYLNRGEKAWKIPKHELLLALALLIPISIRIFSGGYSTNSLLLFPIFTSIILIINLFIIPQTISPDAFFGSLSRITAVLTLFAIPIWLFSPINIGTIEFIRWDDSFLRISSIFANPNTLAKLAMVGFFGALLEYNRRRTTISKVLILITVIVVLLSYSRAVMAAIAIAMIVYFVQTRINSSAAIFCVLGLFSAMLCFLFTIYFGFTPPVLDNIDFSGRLIIWDGVAKSLQGKEFWIGHGFKPASETIDPYLSERWHSHGPHNAYYNWWIRGGIVTMITFLMLFWGAILRHYQAPKSNPVIGALGIAWSVVLLFGAPLLIGAGIFPVLMSISLGYIITDTANTDLTVPKVDP